MGGIYDFASGKLTINKVYYEFDGSENWDKTTTSGNPVVRVARPSGIKSNDTAYAASNMLVRVTSASIIYGDKFDIGGSNIVIGYDDTLENWKAFIGENLLQFGFELETPQEITLTPADVNLLKGSNTVWTDGDTVQVKYSELPNGNLGAVIDYIKKLEARIAALES